MLSPLRGRPRVYSTLLYRSPVFSKPACHRCSAYATTPNPRRNNKSESKSTSKATTSKAEVSTKTSPTPLQSALPTQSPASRINPPASTHPPSLNLPTRTPNDPIYKYYFGLGKAYANFYKTGLKALWTNYRTGRSLPHSIWSRSPSEIRKAVRNGALSRADFQLIRRVKSDLYKLPPFALLFAICGEFTPLVIVFVTGLVPRIIWIPKQVQGAREKARDRRRRCQQLGGFEQTAGAMILRDDISRLTGSRQREAYKYVAQSSNLYSESLDKYVPSLIPPGLVRRRVDRSLKDLQVDDLGIARDGGVRSMNKEEVVLACEERGLEILGKEESDLRKNLTAWIEERVKSSREMKNDKNKKI